MAKKRVENFTVEIKDNSVIVEIHTENVKPYKYVIFPDTRQGDVSGIAKHLNAGLSEAKENFKKIDVSEYFERRYVFINTPIERHSDQYTADKL